MRSKNPQRIFALFFAILFLVTSSSLAIAFIWANVESKNNSGSQTPATTQATNKSTTKLQGTVLQGFTPTSDVSSLKITDIKVGSGVAVKTGDTVSVDYTGALASTGVVFQSSLDSGQPVSLAIAQGQVIEGWVQGLPGMQVGGTRQLLIPASLAYASNPPSGSGIPPNAPLVFNITLHSITPATK